VFRIYWHAVNVWCDRASALLLLANTVTDKLNSNRKVSHPHCIYGITRSIMKSVQTQLYLSVANQLHILANKYPSSGWLQK